MQQLFNIFFIFFIINNLVAQGREISAYANISVSCVDSIPRKFQDEIVNTPFGPSLKSNVHFVGSEHQLNIKDDLIQIVQTKTGVVTKVFNNVLTKNNTKDNKNIFSSLKSKITPSDSKDGWITYAYCYIYGDNPKPPTYFSTNYIVPSPPKISSNQLLYLFNGLGGGGTYGRILQPVLQWGVSPAGGGDYWAICNWYVSNGGQFFYDSLIKVSPGTILQGVIKLTSSSNNIFNYNSSFIGYSTGLQVNSISQLETPYIVFETYNVKGCDEYPFDEKVKMFNIQIITDINYPPVNWWTYDDLNDPVINCGQFTKIVSKSSYNGQIDIHFHTPYSIDNFKEIHIYPNPVEDLLHISPNYIEDPLHLFPDKPITNCKIEIYNSFGRLLRTDFYENLDFEFNMDLRNFEPGLYIIKFSYDNKTHAFKIIKK